MLTQRHNPGPKITHTTVESRQREQTGQHDSRPTSVDVGTQRAAAGSLRTDRGAAAATVREGALKKEKH